MSLSTLVEGSWHSYGLGESTLLLLVASICLYAIYWTSYAIYSLTFHPLARFPGPKLWAISRIPYALSLRSGRFIYDIKKLHDKYGHAVRVAPDELTFTDSTVWKDAYQHHHGQREFPKADVWLRDMVNGTRGILYQNDADHTRTKRLLTHAFSERALRGQEHFVKGHVDMLVKRLRDKVEIGEDVVDVVDWMTWTVTDIIGDLSFGQPFDCLRNSSQHSWAATAFKQFRGAVLLTSLRYFPGMEKLLLIFLSKSITAERWEAYREAQRRITTRIESGSDRRDFIHYVQRYNDEKGMSRDEIDSTFTLFVVAGAETVSTFLVGINYCLLNNQDVLDKVVRELRGAFKTEEEMTDAKIEKLPYFNATIKEGLRYIPPGAWSHPRKVPKGGGTVAGHALPEDTVVSVVAWAASRSARNFKDPLKFDPDRWLNHNGYDDFNAYQPFSVGPRGCIGRSLANVEMRLVYARFLWNFDISIPEGGTKLGWKWEEQNAFMVWEKIPFWIRLKVAKH